MTTRIISSALLLIAIFSFGIAQADQQAASSAAIADLARRLNLPAEKIKVASIAPQTFPDASLGLSRPDEMYAQMLTPGYVITLFSGRWLYLYTATDRRIRYGGPVDSWALSALYLQPVENEPNLNGNLMQVSLAGTNPQLLLESVSAFWPQADGSVLAKRRTSRSGHDLFYLMPGQTEAKRLLSAFDLTTPAVSNDGSRWAAFTRPRVGGDWQFTVGSLSGGNSAMSLPEDSRPEKLWWNQDNPVILVAQGEKQFFYELKPGENEGTWQKLERYYPPDRNQLVLNKSQTLVAETVQVDGKPMTRVVKHWWNGNEDPVVTIPNFTVGQTTLLPGHRFALLSGLRDERNVALTVDIATGEVMQTVECSQGEARLLSTPPQARLINEILQKMRQGPPEE
ncbi:MAG: hypothetical protein ACYC63_19225 [Armatimonadota bacterium]